MEKRLLQIRKRSCIYILAAFCTIALSGCLKTGNVPSETTLSETPSDPAEFSPGAGESKPAEQTETAASAAAADESESTVSAAAAPSEHTVEETAAFKLDTSPERPEGKPVITKSDKEYVSMQWSGDAASRIAGMGEKVLLLIGDDLYMLDQKTDVYRHVSECTADRIYYDGTDVFYSPSYYSGRGIFRLNPESGSEEKISEDLAVQMFLHEDRIYYVRQQGWDDINQTPQGDLCVMNKDGSKVQVLIPRVKNYFTVHGDTIYYTDWDDRNIYRAGMDGSGKTLMAEGRTYIMASTDEYLFYSDYSDNEAVHMICLTNGENRLVGRGQLYCYHGEFYFYGLPAGADGSIADIEDTGYVMLQLNRDTGELESSFSSKRMVMFRLRYVYNGCAYLQDSRDSKIYLIYLDDGSGDGVNKASYSMFLDGYMYFTERMDGEVLYRRNLQSNLYEKYVAED